MKRVRGNSQALCLRSCSALTGTLTCPGWCCSPAASTTLHPLCLIIATQAVLQLPHPHSPLQSSASFSGHLYLLPAPGTVLQPPMPYSGCPHCAPAAHAVWCIPATGFMFQLSDPQSGHPCLLQSASLHSNSLHHITAASPIFWLLTLFAGCPCLCSCRFSASNLPEVMLCFGSCSQAPISLSPLPVLGLGSVACLHTVPFPFLLLASLSLTFRYFCMNGPLN